MDLPLISVITICYNSRDALETTMKNVLGHNYPNLEYIVIDGKSNDGSLEVIKKYSSSLSYWISEKDNGIYDAMNKGIQACKGKYAIFMNAGDTFASGNTLYNIFHQNIQGDVIYGNVLKDGIIKKAHTYKNSHRMCFCHQSSLTLVKCLRETPFDTKYKMSSDFKFFKILGKTGKVFTYIDEAISKFDTSGISNVNRSEGLKENINIVWEVDCFFDKLRLLPRLLWVYCMCKIRGK